MNVCLRNGIEGFWGFETPDFLVKCFINLAMGIIRFDI